jgi:uncharacterized protein (TIGR02996 family)
MLEDEPFLRAMLADPDDRVCRQVYADWLADRSDPRAEYPRLAARVAELPFDHPERPELRRWLHDLQQDLPTWWVAIVGGLRAGPKTEPDFAPAIEQVARVRHRPTKRQDEKGYDLEVTAAATSPLNGAVAYLESCSKWEGNYHDIHYHLNLRDPSGHVVACDPHTYNPYFGCEPKFLAWYGDAVLFIYREKHSTYAARFGLRSPAVYQRMEDYWLLDGPEITFIGYRKPTVQRLSVHNLEPLEPLTPDEAQRRGLMPETPSWWLNGA